VNTNKNEKKQYSYGLHKIIFGNRCTYISNGCVKKKYFLYATMLANFHPKSKFLNFN
jgi:hypothetical protein